MQSEYIDDAWAAVQDALPAGWHVETPSHDARLGVWSVTAVGLQPNSDTPSRVTGTGDTDIRALNDLTRRLSPAEIWIPSLGTFSIRRPWSPAGRPRISRWGWGGVALGLLASLLILLALGCPDGAQAVLGLLFMGAIGSAVLGAATFLLPRVSAFLLGACLGFGSALVLIFGVFAQDIHC